MQIHVRSKKQVAVIVFMLFVLILSACGGDDNETEPTPNDGLPSVTPRGGEPPTEQAGLPSVPPPITPTATRFQGFPTLAVAPTVPPRYPESVQIVSPVTGSQIQGNVTIFGSASSANFVQYALEYGPDPNPSSLWYPITLQAVTVPVLNNALGAWNTTLVPDGTYQMRLHVYLQNGQELTNAVVTGLQVRNQQSPTEVSVQQNTLPVISPIAPLNLREGQSVTLALGTYDADGDALSFLASSDNTAVASAVPSGQALTVTAANAGIATVRVQVTDNRGGNAETSFLVTVTAPVDNNNPPNIIPIPSQVLTVGSTINVPLSISDPDGDSFDFSVQSAAPTVVQVSKATTGSAITLQGLQAGSTTVTITAADVGGRTSTTVFSAVVTPRTPANNLPVITTIPSQSIEVSQIRTIPLSISDPDGDPVTFTVESSATSVLTVITLDSNTIQIGGVSAGQASVTIIVRDNRGGSTSTLFTVVVTEPLPTNENPTIEAIPDQTIEIGQTVDIDLVMSDPDGGTLTFSTTSANSGTVSTGPVDSDTLRILGIAEDSTTVTVSVGDGQGGSATTSFNVTVNPSAIPNQDPSIDPIDDQLLEGSQTVLVTIAYSDPDDDTLAVTATSGTAEVATVFQSSATELAISGNTAGTATITVTVEDGRGGTTSTTFNVTVTTTNQPPNIAPIPSQSCESVNVITLTLSYNDPDGDDVTISVQSENELIALPFLLDDQVTLEITCDAVGQALITVTADDQRDGTTITTFIVSVNEANQAPILDDIPSVEVEVGDIISAAITYSDPDGDSMTVSAISSDSEIVTVIVSSPNELSVNAIAAGLATITVSVDDGRGGTASKTFTVTVGTPNLPPTIDPIADVDLEVGDSVPVAISYNDPDGDPVSVTPTSNDETIATVVVASDTELTVNAVNGGVATITVTVEDDQGNSNSTNFLVTVNAPNLPPTISPIASINVEAGQSIPVGISYNDPDGDAVSVTPISSDESIATVSFNSNTELSVTGGAAGEATITVTVEDGQGNSNSTNFLVTVNTPNQAPTIDPIAPINIEAGQSVPVAITYSDPDGDPVTVTPTSSDEGIATVILASDTELSVTGVAVGEATITVTVEDDQGNSNSAQFLVSVGAPNQAPTIDPIAPINIEAGQSVPVAIPYSDPDGDPVTVTPVSNDEAVATVILASDTELSVTGVSVGEATITVTVEDDQGNSNSAEFLVSVGAPNQAPTIDPIAPINIESGQSVPVTITYSDPDGDPVTVTPTSSDEAVATVILASDTELSISGVSVGEATITVTVEDDQGNSNSAEFLVSVGAPNEAPTIDPIAPINIESGQSVPVAITYSDPDGDPVTVTPVSNDEAVATVILASDTELSVTGVDVGEATITVTVEDDQGNSNSAEFLVSVGAPNQAPTIDPIAPINIESGQSVPVSITYSDPDGDPVTVTPTSNDEAVATVILASDTELSVTGVAVGEATITVTVEDDQGNSNSAEFLVSVGAPNQAPTIDPIAPINIESGQSVLVTITYSDPDSDPVTVTPTSSDEGIATVILSSDTELSVTGVDVGEATITVTVEDDQGNSNSAEFLVSVGAPNQAPTIDPIAPINIEAGQSVPVTITYSDPDGDPVTVTTTSSDEAIATVILSSDTELSVTGVDVGEATITVTVEDGEGNSNSAQFLVSVGAPNQAPTIDPIAPINIESGQSVPVAITYSDPDGDPVTVTPTSSDEAIATVILASDTELSVTGVSVGEATITVTVEDDQGNSNSAEFLVSVGAPNQAPVIDPIDPVTVEAGQSASVVIFYADPEGDPVFPSVASDDENVATAFLASDTDITITGVNAGTATVTVTVDDGNGGTNSAAFTVTVESPNQAPTIDDLAPLSLIGGESIPVAINYADPDGDIVAVSASSDDENVATVALTGDFEISVTAINAGTATITVTVDDGNGGTDNTTFTVSVEAPNQAPTIDPIAPITIDVGDSLPVAINYSDPDGDVLTLTSTSDNEGVATVFVSDTFELTVTGVSAGVANITVDIDDGSGGINSTAFEVTVASPNQAPIIDPVAPVTVAIGESLPIALNYSDPEGDTLTVTPTSDDEGVATVFLSNTFELTLTGVAAGTANITVDVDDGNGGNNSTAFEVTVSAPNQPPTIDPIAPIIVDLGQSLPVAINYSDPEDDVVTVTPISDNEAVASVFVSNTFELTVVGVGVGTANVTVTVDDGNGGTNSAAFTVTIAAPNQAPTIDPIAPVVVDLGQSLPIAINYSDPDGDVVTVTPTSDNEAVASVFLSNTFELTVIGIGVGNANITVMVDDGNGGTNSTAFVATVAAPNQAPTIDPIAPVVVDLGQSLPIAINYSDPEGDVVTVTPISDNEAVASVFLSNTFELTVTGIGAGNANITVNIDDGRGGTNSTAFAVTVSSPNQAPTIDPIAPVTIDVGASLPVAINYGDLDGDVVTVTPSSDNEGVATVFLSNTFELTVTGVGAGSANITVNVDDGRGGTNSTAFAITVSSPNQAPTIDPIAPISVTAGQSLPVAINYSDLDGDVVTVTPTSDNEGVATVFLNNTFELMVTSVADGTANITVNVDDGRGGTNSTAFAVTVSTANQDPTIDPIAPQTCLVGDASDLAINFADPDGDPLSVTAVSDNLGIADALVIGNTLTVNCLGEGLATITVSADDGRGGLASTQFTVEVGGIIVPPGFDVSVYPELPDIDELSDQLLPVYTDGVNNLGRLNTAFSIAGDDSLSGENLMDPIALAQYDLGNNPELQATIDHYNFTFQSVAVDSDWTVETLLDPAFADPGLCQAGETPLNCELRLTSPVVLFISFSPTNATSVPIGTFIPTLEQIVDATLDAGTIPVLVTLPDDGTVDLTTLSDYNQAIVNVATQHSLHPDLDVPLWNLYNTMQGATSGVYAASPSGPADFSDPSLVYGVNRRGLAALQILDRVRLTFFP